MTFLSLFQRIMKTLIHRAVFACLLVYSLTSVTHADNPVNTLIIVPDASGAAEKIYAQVIAGVESNRSLNTTVLKVSTGNDAAWLGAQLPRYNAELIIPIGNKSYSLCNTLNRQQTNTNLLQQLV